jgi:septal ring factor EnvC (AmiA/AmiB activator)
VIQASCRVEGRGTATIHDVALSNVFLPPVETTSASIEALLSKKQRTEKALERCKKSSRSLEAYLSTLNAQHVDATALEKVIYNYEANGAVLDEKAMNLEKGLEDIDEQLENERKNLAGPRSNDKLHQRATIGVFAEAEGQVEMALIYGMWSHERQDTVSNFI